MTIGEQLPEQSQLVPLDEAAERLSVSRRTVERLIADGELERMRVGGRAYVTDDSLIAVQRRRGRQVGQRDVASGAAAVLAAAVEALTESVRRDRAELLQALGEREQLRVDLARVTAELDAERTARGQLEAELVVRTLRLTASPSRLG